MIKYYRQGGLNNRNKFCSRAEKFNIKVQQGLILVRTLFMAYGCLSSPLSSHGREQGLERERESMFYGVSPGKGH